MAKESIRLLKQSIKEILKDISNFDAQRLRIASELDQLNSDYNAKFSSLSSRTRILLFIQRRLYLKQLE